jgi:hypothetical protein
LRGIESPKKKQRASTPPLPDSDEIERRLLNETIDETVGMTSAEAGGTMTSEVAGVEGMTSKVAEAIGVTSAVAEAVENTEIPVERTVNETEPSWLDSNLEERMLRQNIIKEGFKRPLSFAERVQAAATSSTFNGESFEALAVEANVNMTEHKRTDIDSIITTDPFKEATTEELAELGIFNTSIGRQLFDKINGIEAPPLVLVPDVLVSGEKVGTTAVPSSVPEVLRVTSIDAEFLSNIELPPVDDPSPITFRAHSIEVTSTPAEKTTTPRAVSIAQLPQTPVVAATNRRSSMEVGMSQREEAFAELAAEVVEQKKQKQKRRRRKPQQQQRSRTPEPVTVVELNKPLIRHRRKALIPRDFVAKLLFHFPTDTQDYSSYQPDPPEDEVVADKPPAERKVQSTPKEDMGSLAEILGIDDAPPARKNFSLPSAQTRFSQTPLNSPVRDGTMKHVTPRDVLDEPLPVNDPSKVPSSSPAPETHTTKRLRIANEAGVDDPYQAPDIDYIELMPPPTRPSVNFSPALTSTAQRKTTGAPQKQKIIDFHDLSFASLKHRSQQSFKVTSDNNKEKEQRRPRREGNDDEFDESGNRLFRRFMGKYHTMIEFVGTDRRSKKCSEYSMEVSVD